MPRTVLSHLLHLLHRSGVATAGMEISDGALLDRFLTGRDEAAFATLLERHGPMVLSVCQRVLGDAHTAEDAFQATFLVLARRAASIRNQASLASWLFGVARRIASKARAQTTARREREKRVVAMKENDHLDEPTWQELRAILDQEIDRLPEKLRAAIVLCHLEGKSYDQAAQVLGCPKSTLASRMTKAHELLRGQLTRRGVALSAGALATALAEKASAAPVAAAFIINGAKAAGLVAAGKNIGDIVSAQALTFAEEAMKGMIGIKTKLALLVATLCLVVGAGYAGYGAWVSEPPPAGKQPPVVQGDPVQKKAPRGPATDQHGDPLPEGAVARLGATRFRHGLNTVAMAYSPDGKWLASLSGGVLYVLDAGTGKVLRRHSFARTLDFVQPDNSALAFTSDSKTIVTPRAVIDVVTGKELRQLQEDKSEEILRQFQEKGVLPDPTASAWTAAVSPDGQLLARQVWAGKGTGVILIDVATGKERRVGWDDKEVKAAWFGKPKDGAKPPARPVFSSNGTLLATASADKVIRLWKVETGEEVGRLQGHEQAVNRMAISPDGKTLASTGQGEGLIRLWDVPLGKALREIKIDAPNVGIWFAPDGKLLTTDSAAGAICLYDCGSGKELRRWQMPCVCLAFSPDGKELATAEWQDYVIHRWDMRANKGLNDTARNHTKPVASLQFAPDGKTLYSLDISPIAMEWDLATMRSRNTTSNGPVGSVKLFGGKASSPTVSAAASDVRLSPTGKVAAVYNSRKGAVYLCDVVTGKGLHILRGEYKNIYAPRFSPDGKIVAMGMGPDGRLWDVATGMPLRHPPLPPGSIKAWSADGKLLAILNVPKKWETRIHVCKVATGEEVRRFEFENIAAAIALSSDGKSLAVFSWDITYTNYELVVFDTATGKKTDFLAASSEAGRSGFDDVAFSPSGQYLAVAVRDTVQLWEVRTAKKIREFRAGHTITALRFSPDGRTLASGGEDSTILLWGLTRIARPKAQE